MMSSRFANKLLFDQAPIDLVDPTNTGIPDVQFATVFGKTYPTTFEEIYAIINDAKELGLKGVCIDKNDYTYSGGTWEVWFAGSPEDIIVFSLKHKKTMTLSQEEMNSALDKARELLVYYPGNSIDFCYVITRIVTNEPILMQNAHETQVRDVSNLVNYTLRV